MIDRKTAYTFTATVSVPFDEAERLVRAALEKEGFGILTEADVRAAFREKLGRPFRRYKILGACNPSLAHRALSVQLEIGALLPCNIVLYEEGGTILVSTMDPVTVLDLVGDPEVGEIAREVRTRLERALEQTSAWADRMGNAARRASHRDCFLA